MAIAIRFFQFGKVETMRILSSDPLLWIICSAPIFLGLFAWIGGRQNDKVRDFSEQLEKKVIERTKSLSQANAKLSVQSKNQQSLLEGLHEGIFYFDKHGKIANERSPALEKILPGSEKLTTVCDFFSTYAGTTSKSCQQTLEWLWDDMFFSPFLDTARMLAKEISYHSESGTRTLRFDYKELFDSHDVLEKVIVFVNDITDEKEAQASQRRQAERIKRISMAAANTESYTHFLEDAITFFKVIDSALSKPIDIDTAKLKRDIHTLKGNTATFEFSSLAASIHQLEDLFEQNDKLDFTGIRAKWDQIKDQWKFETTDIEEVLKLQKHDHFFRVEKQKYLHLKELAEVKNDENLSSAVQNLEEYSTQDVLGKYVRLVKNLSSRKNKGVQVVFAKDCSELSFSDVLPLDGALVHIFRNSIDHGIETFETREKIGKPGHGLISIGCYKNKENLHLVIKDDGAGIDTHKLGLKALSSGKWSKEAYDGASEQDKLNLIFSPSLSTAEEITETSGRGVGMDAVKNFLEELGGNITVFSQLGSGTQFEIDIPLHLHSNGAYKKAS